jgi:hypothetical protein
VRQRDLSSDQRRERPGRCCLSCSEIVTPWRRAGRWPKQKRLALRSDNGQFGSWVPVGENWASHSLMSDMAIFQQLIAAIPTQTSELPGLLSLGSATLVPDLARIACPRGCVADRLPTRGTRSRCSRRAGRGAESTDSCIPATRPLEATACSTKRQCGSTSRNRPPATHAPPVLCRSTSISRAMASIV